MKDRGVELLLTRPEAASRRLLALCEARLGRRVRAVVSPVMAIRPVDPGPLPEGARLVLTSEAGAARARALGLAGREAWCVGRRTAEAARAAGLVARMAGPEAGGDADGLVAALLALRPEGPLLHLRGEHARGEVAARLRAGGLAATEAVAYAQVALPPTAAARAALDGADPLVAPLLSPRSARLLAAWGPRAPLDVVAMSPAVAGAAAALAPRRMVTAARPEAAAVAEAVAALLGEGGGAGG